MRAALEARRRPLTLVRGGCEECGQVMGRGTCWKGPSGSESGEPSEVAPGLSSESELGPRPGRGAKPSSGSG